jgi:hypothetical protein
MVQLPVPTSSVVRPPLHVQQPILDFLMEVLVFFSIGLRQKGVEFEV